MSIIRLAMGKFGDDRRRRNDDEDDRNMGPLPRMSLRNVHSWHFKQYFRMEKPTFEKLLNRLAPHITKQEGKNRTVQADTALMACLMELAGGSAQWLIARAAGISQSTLSRRIDDFLEAVEIEMTSEFLGWYRSREEREAASLDFFQKSKFRNCLGIIDGTHVVISAPMVDEPAYVNCKGYVHSELLMIIYTHYGL